MKEFLKDSVRKIGLIGPWTIFAFFWVVETILVGISETEAPLALRYFASTISAIGLIGYLIWPFARLEVGAYNKDTERWQILFSVLLILSVIIGCIIFVEPAESAAVGFIVMMTLVAYFGYLTPLYFRLLTPGTSYWFKFALFLAIVILPLGCFSLVRIAPKKRTWR